MTTGSIASVGKNSAHQAYGNYNPGNLTLRQIVNIWSDLIARYDRIKAKIIHVASKSTPPVDLTGFDFDDPVFCQMKNQLAIENGANALPDISMIRFDYGRRGRPEFAAA